MVLVEIRRNSGEGPRRAACDVASISMAKPSSTDSNGNEKISSILHEIFVAQLARGLYIAGPRVATPSESSRGVPSRRVSSPRTQR